MQEALQNVSAHSQANGSNVTIDFLPDRLELTIQDNGRGFDLHALQQDGRVHLGLFSMRERAERLNGVLTVQSRPGQGTKVVLTVPVEPVMLNKCGD